MTTIAAHLAQMHAEVFDERAVPCTLAGEAVRVIINEEAQIMLGEIYDRRPTAKFLAAETEGAGLVPTKGAVLEVGERSWTLDQRLPTGSAYINQWILR